MKFRVYIASSVDGFVATADGGVKWLDAFHDPEGYDYDRFIRQIDAIVIGRATFDQVLGFGPWPYEGRHTYVLTSRPIDNPPPLTVAWRDGATKLVERLRGMALQGDVWLLGGPKSIGAFRELDAVDTYEVYVMPVLLGAGIPLFVENHAATRLDLVDSHAFADGVVRLVYQPAQQRTGQD